MPLQVVSHYEVEELIGQGGMGSVYRARDLSLDRYVALKFLSPSLAGSSSAKARFLKEGRALSSLSHPHIATVYEAGESDGTPFLALELLPGGTLRSRLKNAERAGALLNVSHVIKWATELAEGLAHAHRHGIIHRDIKPANIMFDAEGRIKLTDFGLARRTSGDSHSEAGHVAGTFGYMSPEQFEGRTADHRSDQFSFGVVLYEMATGVMPFRGSTPGEVTLQVLTKSPSPPSQVRPDLPKAFDSLIERLLAKKPESRFERSAELVTQLQALQTDSKPSSDEASTVTQSPVPRPRRRWHYFALAALAVLIALLWNPARQWISAPSGPVQKHIAVLPFRNIGGDASQESFCDGLTETLTAALTRQPELSVVAPTEARKLETAAQARSEFGVHLVLSGSVQRRGSSLRLVIALIDAETQRQIDALPIDWPVSRLSSLEEGILTKVADLLNVAMPQQQRTRLSRSASQVASAHDAYLRGRGFLYRYDVVGNLDRARSAFQEATRLDPNFAAAYVGLSEALWRIFRTRQDPALLQSARTAASRAVEINPQFASAQLALGSVLVAFGRPAEAEKVLQTALQLDPLDPAIYRELAKMYQGQRQFAQAEQVLQRAVAVRPGDWISYTDLGAFYRSQQRYPDAEAAYRRVVELSPDNHLAYRNLGVAQFSLGRNRDAEAMFRKSLALRPTAMVYSNLGALLMFEKHYAEAVPVMEQAARLAASESSVTYRLWGNLGDAYWLAKREPDKARGAWRKAAEILERQLTGTTADAERLGLLANYRAKSGDRPEAIRGIEAAINYAPESATVRYQAGLTYALLGQNDRALSELRLAVNRGYSLSEIRAAPELESLRRDPKYESLSKPNTGR